MKKIGQFWVPDIDAAPGRNLRRSKLSFEHGDGIQIWHLKRALELVPGRELAVDGGSNVGAWTKLMAQHFKLVVSFEPNREAYQCLLRNVTEWGISGNVQTHCKAISDRHESVRIETKEEGLRTTSSRVVGAGDIPGVPIDSLDLRQCSFLKFDLEGYEDKALLGSADTIARFRPWILIENKPTRRQTINGRTAAERVLADMNYALVERIGDNEIDWLYKPP